MKFSARLHLTLLLSLVILFIWSAIHPRDWFTWTLEVAPVVAAVVVLLVIYRHFRFTPMAYILIWLHAVVLLVGGHYTYAQVPLFDWLSEWLGLERNHYDRLGHFMQGFCPAILAREVLLRASVVRRGGWLFGAVICFCLALSAFYELIEWWVAAATGSAADSFLGTQGDPWDTQWDMCLALIGAVAAQATLGRLHDHSLASLSKTR